jgi:glycosyltransferase involved in cell wall biosynthesis
MPMWGMPGEKLFDDEFPLVDFYPPRPRAIYRADGNPITRRIHNKYVYEHAVAKLPELCEDTWLYGAAELIALRKYDIVGFSGVHCALEAVRLKKKFRIPFIYEAYEYWPSCLSAQSDAEQKPSIWIERERAMIRLASTTITIGEEVKGLYECDVKGVEVAVVYNVAPSPPITPSDLLHPLAIYYHSGIRPHYGIESLIEALSFVEGDVHLTIQGYCTTPEYLESLERLICACNVSDKVSFLEPCQFDESVKKANEYDVGIFVPSQTLDGKTHLNNSHGCPNKLFVYSSAGLAMILSSLDGLVARLADSGMVEWCDGDSARDVARAIQSLVDNPCRVEAMKKAAHRWSLQSDYSIAQAKRTTVSVYAKGLGL